MYITSRFALTTILLMGLAACNTTQPMAVQQSVKNTSFQSIGLNENKASFALAKLVSDIGRGDQIFAFPAQSTTRGTLCNYTSRNDATVSYAGGKEYLGDWSTELGDVFHETLSSLGYDIAGDPDDLFGQERAANSAEFLVGGRLVDMSGNFCHEHDWWTYKPLYKYSGEMSVSIEWSVLNTLTQDVVLKENSTGYFKLNETNSEGILVVFENAFADAAESFGRSPKLRQLATTGPTLSQTQSVVQRPAIQQQPQQPSAQPAPVQPAPAQPAPVQPVPVQPAVQQPVAQPQPQTQTAALRATAISQGFPTSNFNMAELRPIVVTVRVGQGHGSGFFVGNQGHVITNAHVVGDANSVLIITSQGVEFLGTVVNRNRARDVALVTTDAIIRAPAYLQRRLPKVTDTVMAVGTPLDESLDTTITQGIISAIRQDSATGQSFIQADAAISPGNSGGPLVNQRGEIIGVSVAKYTGAGAEGISLFIPLDEALRSVGLNVQ